MLTLVVEPSEFFNEETNEFVYIEGQTILLEHSLYSVSKWESKWKKSFFQRRMTVDEFRDYVRCMTITRNVNPIIYQSLTVPMRDSIQKYMDDTMTATTFKKNPEQKSSSEIITSELIYYWMLKFNIPFECDKWHLNRLLTLIQVCERKENPQKKMSRGEILAEQYRLNEERKKKYKTRG